MTYLTIPVDLLKRQDLTANDKLVAAVIKGLDGDKGCYCSNQYIADLLGLKKGTVSNIIAKLSKLGIVKVSVKNFNERTINYIGKIVESVKKIARTMSKRNAEILPKEDGHKESKGNKKTFIYVPAKKYVCDERETMTDDDWEEMCRMSMNMALKDIDCGKDNDIMLS